jgi:hypothetical protein
LGLEHFTYLLNILKKFHGIQYNMAGGKFAGLDIESNSASHGCRISMPGYIFAAPQIQASTTHQTMAISI